MNTRRDRLKDLRYKLNLTQQEVADLIGVGRERYAQWELYSEREIPFETKQQLAKALKTTPDYIDSGNTNINNINTLKNKVGAGQDSGIKDRLIEALERENEMLREELEKYKNSKN